MVFRFGVQGSLIGKDPEHKREISEPQNPHNALNFDTGSHNFTKYATIITYNLVASIFRHILRKDFIDFWSPFLLTWIVNPSIDYTHYKVLGEMIYPFPNFNGATVEVWEWVHPRLYWSCDYLSMMGLKLNHVNKMDLWHHFNHHVRRSQRLTQTEN